MSDQYFTEEAIKEACKGVVARDGGPFGAIVIKDGTLIATGHNEVLAAFYLFCYCCVFYCSFLVLKTCDPTAHGEVVAIRKASEALRSPDLSGCTLYTSGWPCPMCMGACLFARVDRVVYGATADQISKAGFHGEKFQNYVASDMKNEEIMKFDHCAELTEELVNEPFRVFYEQGGDQDSANL